MRNLLLFIITIFVFPCESNIIYDYGVDNANQNIIVNEHNSVRLKIANGKVQGQPKGTNLKKMHWDQNLADEAQKIANTTKFDHVKVKDSRWGAVGQNLYISYSTSSSLKPNWKAAINAWFEEHKLYKYPGGFSSKTGHYTQLVWADTDHVGCGYTAFKTSSNDAYTQKLYVCNYGPAGNYRGELPYKTGTRGCENLC